MKMSTLFARRLEPRTGAAFEITAGQLLRITDPLGEQVSDLVSFSTTSPRSWLSSGRTIDYANTISLTAGNTLYSNRSEPMWTIVEDMVGRHDFLLTPCSSDTFRIIYGIEAPRPSCFGNLSGELAQFGIMPDEIPTTLNVFMNVQVGAGGVIAIGPPLSRAGDYVLLRSEMDMIVGVTACSAELSNNGSFKPIDLEVLSLE